MSTIVNQKQQTNKCQCKVIAASIIRVIIALLMEATRTYETLVNFYQTTQHYNPEDGHLCTHRHENLKSYTVKVTKIMTVLLKPLHDYFSYHSFIYQLVTYGHVISSLHVTVVQW
jgi:hypothetical protein